MAAKKSKTNRRQFLQKSVIAGSAMVSYPALAGARVAADSSTNSSVAPFELDELTIADLSQGMNSGQWTCRDITQRYLERIQEIDRSGPTLNSVIELNPDAIEIAERLDKERKEKSPRGPLHGIPILIKDNLDTADKMMTTAGSLALVGAKPTQDSFVVQRLRAAGAIILPGVGHFSAIIRALNEQNLRSELMAAISRGKRRQVATFISEFANTPCARS